MLEGHKAGGALTYRRCAKCGALSLNPAGSTRCPECGTRPSGASASKRPASARTARTPRTVRPLVGKLVGVSCWAYALGLLVVLGLLRWGAERWALPTLWMYGPRWAWGLPLLGLLPASLVFRRRALPVLAASALVVLGPIMGFCVPWKFWASGDFGPSLRVLTCNAGGREMDLDAFRLLVEAFDPDLIFLQEWGSKPSPVENERGWEFVGQSGLRLASRFPIEAWESGRFDARRSGASAGAYRLELPNEELIVFNVHLETPREGIESVVKGRLLGGYDDFRAVKARRWEYSESLSAEVKLAAEEFPVVIAGDFNLTTDSPIFHRFWSSFQDAFSVAGFGFGTTKQTRWFGARIDHVLVGPGWKVRRCWVGPDVGSDHLPVLAELVRVPEEP